MPKKSEKIIATRFFYYNFTNGKSTIFCHLVTLVMRTFIVPFCLFIQIKL